VPDWLTWAGPVAQILIAALGVFAAWRVGRGAARSSDRAVFTAQREHAIELATSDDADKQFIGALLIEELANSDLATPAELATMAAISAALASGQLSTEPDQTEDLDPDETQDDLDEPQG
jgi:hypothetical protein